MPMQLTVFRGSRGAIPIFDACGKTRSAKEAKVAIAAPKEWHVHGDGRPFSITEMKKVAYLYPANVLAVIEPLDPSRRYSAATLKGIAAIMAAYLGPRLLKQKYANHGASLRALDAIARDTLNLAKRIESLDQDYLLLIEDKRFEPFDPPEVERFDMTTLHKKLVRLSHATERARAALEPLARGAPPAAELDVAIEQLLALLEREKLTVLITESGARTVRRDVSGPGGELLLALFKAFDRHTTAPQIWGAIDRVQTKAREPGVSDDPPTSG